MAILDENEFTEVDGRSYLNPQIALDESNAFIDNLRSTQQSDNQKIQMDTYNLGTDISSNLGGLTSPVKNGNGGAGLSYFTSRYQVPQTAAAVANLRSTAQAAALNQALQNEQEIWKKKYNDAYRNYQKRMNNKTNAPSTDLSDILKKLGYDVNEDDYGSEGNNGVSLYDENATLPYGKVIPMSGQASRWGDPKTGAWYILKSPKEIDAIAATNTIAGRNPVDGMSQVVNGKTMIYDAGSDMWYERGPYIFGQGGR